MKTKQRAFFAAVGLSILFSGFGATTAQEATVNPIQEAVLQEMDRVRTLAETGKWNDDLHQYFANLVEIAALTADEREFTADLDQAMAEYGGEGGMAAHALASGRIEEALRAHGVVDVTFSVDDIRNTITDFRDNGLSSFLMDAATAIRVERRRTGMGSGIPGARYYDPARCWRECRYMIRRAEQLIMAAATTCLFVSKRRCAQLTGAAWGAYYAAMAFCSTCNEAHPTVKAPVAQPD